MPGSNSNVHVGIMIALKEFPELYTLDHFKTELDQLKILVKNRRISASSVQSYNFELGLTSLKFVLTNLPFDIGP